jgi:hypothetical protein
MKMPNYFSSWRTEQFQCPACRWKGVGSDLILDVYQGLTEYSCPSGDCDQIILCLPHPTTAQVEAAAASGNEEARSMLSRRTSEDN